MEIQAFGTEIPLWQPITAIIFVLVCIGIAMRQKLWKLAKKGFRTALPVLLVGVAVVAITLVWLAIGETQDAIESVLRKYKWQAVVTLLLTAVYAGGCGDKRLGRSFLMALATATASMMFWFATIALELPFNTGLIVNLELTFLWVMFIYKVQLVGEWRPLLVSGFISNLLGVGIYFLFIQ